MRLASSLGTDRSSRIYSLIVSVQSATRWPWTRNLHFLSSLHAITTTGKATTLRFPSLHFTFPFFLIRWHPGLINRGTSFEEEKWNQQYYLPRTTYACIFPSSFDYHFWFTGNSDLPIYLMPASFNSFNYTLFAHQAHIFQDNISLSTALN